MSRIPLYRNMIRRESAAGQRFGTGGPVPDSIARISRLAHLRIERADRSGSDAARRAAGRSGKTVPIGRRGGVVGAWGGGTTSFGRARLRYVRGCAAARVRVSTAQSDELWRSAFRVEVLP